MFPKFVFAMALLLPAATFGQKREIVELQRDIANLNEQVRGVQRSVDERAAELKLLINQALETSQKSNASVNQIESRMKEQLAAPVAGMNTRVEQVSGDVQALRESVNDLTTRIGKLQQALEDLSSAVKTLQTPPTPPPTTGGMPSATGPAGTNPGTGTPTAPPAGMSARQLYDNAMRDRSGGNLDLALQGFQQYLQYYGDTELAPNAQFYVGQIHYDRGEFPDALKAFDTVLERYPENNKTPDAMYMKGMTLLRSNQRNEAAKEFLNVIQKFPRSEVADKARNQRRQLGLSVPGSAAAPSRTRRRTR